MIIVTAVLLLVLQSNGVPPAAVQQSPLPENQIGIVNLRGEFRPLPGLPSDWYFIYPAVSADGKRIVMMAIPPLGANRRQSAAINPPTHLATYTLPSGPLRILEPRDRLVLPVFVPGTSMIAFTRTGFPRSGSSTVMLIDSSGATPPTPVVSRDLLMTSSTWFPGGLRAVIHHNGTTAARDGRLMTFSRDQPDSLTTILADSMLHSHPRLSADGSMLAFVAASRTVAATGAVTRGTTQVMLYRFADSALISLGIPGATQPQWSSTGTQLFFQNGGLYRAAIISGSTPAIGSVTRIPVFQFHSTVSSFAVLPGDSLFVVSARRPNCGPSRLGGRGGPGCQ